jgi:IS5 family transposase
VAKRKPTYRVRNWANYNRSLVARGSLTVWVSPAVMASWTAVPPTGKRGHPQVYADVAIECMATLRAVYHLSLRATQGLLGSILELMKVTIEVPNFSTLSRRQGGLDFRPPQRPAGDGLHLVVDSTGVKVFGEGEWKVRQHGWSKRRTWKKLHLGVDEASGQILAATVTDNSVADATALPGLLDQVAAPLTQVSADKAYDTRASYEAVRQRQARATIPPRRGARIWQHANPQAERLMRDENLRAIRRDGRKAWKQSSGYHRRSLAETAMSRFKRILGPTISARTFLGQAAEIKVRCTILNAMLQLGTPDHYRVA